MSVNNACKLTYGCLMHTYIEKITGGGGGGGCRGRTGRGGVNERILPHILKCLSVKRNGEGNLYRKWKLEAKIPRLGEGKLSNKLFKRSCHPNICFSSLFSFGTADIHRCQEQMPQRCDVQGCLCLLPGE